MSRAKPGTVVLDGGNLGKLRPRVRQWGKHRMAGHWLKKRGPRRVLSPRARRAHRARSALFLRGRRQEGLEGCRSPPPFALSSATPLWGEWPCRRPHPQEHTEGARTRMVYTSTQEVHNPVWGLRQGQEVGRA